MAGYLVQLSAAVICAHGGAAHPLAPNPRVRLSGSPVVTRAAPCAIAGCSSTAPGPCITATWLTGSLRVKVLGQPAVLSDSLSACMPTGQPLKILTTQMRVKGR
jgi:hypothetical protein